MKEAHDGTIDPSADDNWTFAPIGKNINLTFETTAKAKDFIPKESGIEYLSSMEEGFATYTLN